MLISITTLMLSGCTSSLLTLPPSGVMSRLSNLSTESDDDAAAEEAADDFKTRVETSMLGDYISVQGNTVVPLRGIGLVTNLNGTGGDPPPSSLRGKLLEEMRLLDIPGAARILAQPSTALVIVTAYLPPNVRKGQRFDVRVALPPNSDATSLQGGYLLATRLFEEREIRGSGVHKGDKWAIAQGPLLTTFGVDDSTKDASALLSRASIPGGAKSSGERHMEIVLRKRFQSIRKAKQISDAVSTRFHHFDRFNRKIPLADAKSNALVELKSHPTYRNNFPRYHQVIRKIPLAEDDVGRRLRLESTAQRLMNPETSEVAAIELEAIGNEAKPFLRAGLESPWCDVRFFAAEALAYMDDSSGIAVLRQSIADEPAFRVYACAALSNLTSSANALIALRELLHEESLEARYGAVRSISEINDQDHALNTVRFDDRFVLRQIQSNSSPAIHLTRKRMPEVTVFNTSQELQLPAILNGGHRIRVSGKSGEDTVQVIRYSVGRPPVRETCSRRICDILKAAGKLGAYYSDVVQLLIEARQQYNLEGELGIDRLPQAGRSYTSRHDSDPSSRIKRTAGSPARTPGIFDRSEEPQVPPGMVSSSEHRGPHQSNKSRSEESDETASDTMDMHPDTIEGDTAVGDPPAADLDAAEDSGTDDTTSDDDEKGFIGRYIKNPFAQHQF